MLHNANSPHKSVRHSSRGFTLLELLVCIAIIGLLIAVLLPVFSSSREKARASNCLAGLRQVGVAERMYLNEYDSTYAPDVAVADTFGRKGTQLTGCPSSGREEEQSEGLPGFAHNGQLHGFAQAGLAALNESDVFAPPLTVSVGEVRGAAVLTGWIGKEERGRRHHRGANVLFCDGHVKWHQPDAIESIEGINDGTRPTFNPVYFVPTD